MSKTGLLFLMMLIVGFIAPAHASDKTFFSSIQGTWQGPGEIVAGKYKGTKFVCTFDGESLAKATGMNIDGSCRVGLFSQPMNAMVTRAGGGYQGKFLDGANGEGMDVNGGKFGRDRLSVNIIRKDLRGVMVANRSRKNKLNITISVYVGKRLVPVIGMNLDKISQAPREKADKVVTSTIKTDR